MKQVPNWMIWVGQGKEIFDVSFQGNSVQPEDFFVTSRFDGGIIAGPFKSESRALSEISAIVDTSGT